MKVQARRGMLSVVAVVLLCWLALGAGSAVAKPGQLDREFGQGGKVTARLGVLASSGLEPQPQLALAGGGKLLAAIGTTIFKYDAAGEPDPGFGQGGLVTVPMPPDQKFKPSGIAIDHLGRILLAGTTWSDNYTTNSWVSVYRFLPNGALDPSFAAGGVLTTYFGLPISSERPPVFKDGSGYQFQFPVVTASGLTVDSRGRPLITGSWVESQRFCYPGMYWDSHRGFVTRLQTNGSPDPSFNGSGVISDVGTEAAAFPSVGADGKITVATSLVDCLRSSPAEPSLRRFLPGGQPDPGFGSAGRADVPFFEAPEVTVDRFGRPLLAAGVFEEEAVLLRRLAPNGHVNRRFGGLLPIGGSEIGLALGADRKGRALLAMTRASKPSELMLIRRDRDGGADPSFGDLGRTFTSFAADYQPAAVLVDGRGRIIVGAVTREYTPEGSQYSLALARFRGGRP